MGVISPIESPSPCRWKCWGIPPWYAPEAPGHLPETVYSISADTALYPMMSLYRGGLASLDSFLRRKERSHPQGRGLWSPSVPLLSHTEPHFSLTHSQSAPLLWLLSDLSCPPGLQGWGVGVLYQLLPPLQPSPDSQDSPILLPMSSSTPKCLKYNHEDLAEQSFLWKLYLPARPQLTELGLSCPSSNQPRNGSFTERLSCRESEGRARQLHFDCARARRTCQVR